MTKRQIMNLLKKNKFTSAKVTYSGGGDDGNMEFDSITKGKKTYAYDYDSDAKKSYLKCGEEIIELPKARITEYSGEYVNEQWVKKPKRVTKSIEDILTDFGYDAVGDMPDWCNNDGGGGEIFFDVKKNKVQVDHYTNYTQQESSSKTI